MKNYGKKLGGIIIASTALFIAGPAFAWSLQGFCAGAPTTVDIGESVTWTATTSPFPTASSDDVNHYEWSWSGSDDLSGSTESVSKTYSTAGTKNATVIISPDIIQIEKISRTCSVTVNAPPPSGGGGNSSGGGGGLNQPTVVLFQKAMKAPLAFVYLSQIPYTGLSGAGKILLFLFGLAIWSGLVVYALRSRKVLNLAEQLTNRLRALLSLSPTSQPANAFEITDNLLLDVQPLIPTPPATSEMETLLAIEAKKERTLISPDGLKAVIETATAKGEESLVTLGKTIENAKAKFPREDGWLLLNKEKVGEALPQMTVAIPAYGAPEKIAPEIPTAVAQTAEINTFVSLLARGDEKAVANYLRTLREGGKSVERFVRETIMELDSAYRGRLEGENNRRNFVLSQIISRWNGEKTEEIIGILLSIIDKNYKNSTVGLKLAVMRIAELKE